MDYDEQIQNYRREFLEYGGSMDGCGSLRSFDRTQDWINQVEMLNQEDSHVLSACKGDMFAVNIRIDTGRADFTIGMDGTTPIYNRNDNADYG